MATYSRDQLLDMLRKASQTLGTDFRAKDFQAFTGVNYHVVSRAFGSWHDAMLEAGLTPKSDKRLILPADLIHEARALASHLGKNTLTIFDWRSHGSCDDGTVRRRFGSWELFLKEAKLDLGNPQDIPNQKLLKEFGRLHNVLRKPVSPGDMDSMGKYSSSTYIRRWGSWRSAWNCYLESAETSISPKTDATSQTTEPRTIHYGEIINYSGMLHSQSMSRVLSTSLHS
jgi:hypothetical protein